MASSRACSAGSTPRPTGSRTAGGRHAGAAALRALEPLGADRVLLRALDLVRYASDASPYRLIPQAVVMAHDAEDVAKAFAYGRRTGIPVTLRSGGTSLNGQGQGAGILVDVRAPLRRHPRCEDGGKRVRVGPGTVLGQVNRALVKHDRRLGPDPASTDFATVGGVIANNSGGMRCGVRHDSYPTLRSLEFVLPSGTRDRHLRARRRRSASRPRSPSWPPASPRSATRSAPTPS